MLSVDLANVFVLKSLIVRESLTMKETEWLFETNLISRECIHLNDQILVCPIC